MKTFSTIVAVAALAVTVGAGGAHAECKVGRMADLPVTMRGTQPMVPAKINGHDVMFEADSGAFYSMLSPSAASELGLRLGPAPFGLQVRGVGGSNYVDVATVKKFTLTKTDFPDVQFLVGAGAGGMGSVGLLGQNVLGMGDVEYDLGAGAIRMFKVEGCGDHPLAYWAAGQPFSTLDIYYADQNSKKVTGTAYLNGKRIRVLFDTGASTSVMTLEAAERAGVHTNTPGVTNVGYSHGIGPHATREYVGRFASFKIGDEEIQNARLRFSEFELTNADMLLGADFFLSHRVYVSNSQRKLYFTYNGGPVFNLSVQPFVAPTPGPGGASVATEGAGSTAEKASAAAEPTDADGFDRRGAAAAGRRDYEHALADYSRAIELAPNQGRYRYQRALAHMALKQPTLAMTDLDDAIRLNPDDGEALLARAMMRRAARDRTGAIADLDHAASAAPKQADARLELASLYLNMDLFDQAIGQYDLWIASHADEGEMVSALAGRCRSRALANRELDKALGDCNRAIRLGPKAAGMMDSRGLIYLRMGQFDRAIVDYNEALTMQPRALWSLYGRGVARLRAGRKAEGDADIAAALAIGPRFAETARRFGVVPPDGAGGASAGAPTPAVAEPAKP